MSSRSVPLQSDSFPNPNHMFFGQVIARMRPLGSFDASLPPSLTANINVTLAISCGRSRKEVRLAIGVGECPDQFGHFADCRRTQRKHAWRIPGDSGQTLRFPQACWEPREFLRLARGGRSLVRTFLQPNSLPSGNLQGILGIRLKTNGYNSSLKSTLAREIVLSSPIGTGNDHGMNRELILPDAGFVAKSQHRSPGPEFRQELTEPFNQTRMTVHLPPFNRASSWDTLQMLDQAIKARHESPNP
jgi:hypothetical protein